MDEQPALEELARRLWDERRIVNYLLFKLTVTKLLLAADERRFVPDALKEVDRTVELLHDGERRRDEAVRALAAQWQLAPDELTLRELAHRAPPPYDHAFGDHLVAFDELAREIEQVARANRALARSELGAVAMTLDQLTGNDHAATTTYDEHGRVGSTSPADGRLREVL